MSRIIFDYGVQDFEYDIDVIQNLLDVIYDIEKTMFREDLKKDIVVKYTERQGPMCLFEDFSNPLMQRILLSAREHYWAQYAYQFSHELCHLHIKSHKTYLVKSYKFSFFEEALCWLCSICVLFKLSLYKGKMLTDLKSFQWGFEKYKCYVLDASLDQPINFPSWTEENWEFLQYDFCCNYEDDNSRMRARIVATAMSEHANSNVFWEACKYITQSPKIQTAKTFAQFFEIWLSCVPLEIADVVRRIKKTCLGSSNKAYTTATAYD